MRMMAPSRILPSGRSQAAVCAAVLLCSCSNGESQEATVNLQTDDPLMFMALEEQIMVDPDMVSRSGANEVASFPDMTGAVPNIDTSSRVIAAAREEAIAIVGGTSALRRAPPPERLEGKLAPQAPLSVASKAASASQGGADCASLAEFSAIWAARMPEAFPVYPHAAVQEAAGSDAQGCSLRVVNFATAVPPGDVIDFYFTRAIGAGFSTQRVLQDGDDILGGTRDGSSFMLFVRRGEGGLTVVDLVTSGK